jgi:ADP-heptose:LPS heptosyltransferase
MQNKLNENIKKILIIRLSSIGDIILTTELVRLTKLKFAGSEIDFLVSKHFSNVLAHNPNIDNLILYDKNKSRNEILSNRKEYDLVIDLQNNSRSKQFSKNISENILRYKKNRFKKLLLVYFKTRNNPVPPIPSVYLDCLSEFGIKSDGKGLEFWLVDERKKYTPLSRTKSNIIRKIGLAPGAHHLTKQWPKEYFKQLILDLNEKYDNIIFYIFGGENEINTSEFICGNLKNINITDFTGKLTISQTAEKIDRCDLFISNDTGLAHIAAARKVNLAVIFGSTVPEFGFSPYGTNSVIIENNDINCRPCTHIGRTKCPKSHFNCMKDINSREIINSIEKLFPKDS